MKIGVFDSGLGGLLITHSIIQELPDYDYLYLGDTARVPYGNRSTDTIYQFTREAVSYLFQQDCQIIIVACNTASADALRRIQQEYLPYSYPNRRVLGVLIPAAEEAVACTKTGRIGVLATQATVQSGAFVREIKKLKADATVVQQAAPLLVSLIELGGIKFAGPIVEDYLEPLQHHGIDCLILGCTHFPILRAMIEEHLGPSTLVVDQNNTVPGSLRRYLARHPELEQHLAKQGRRTFQVTDLTESATSLAKEWFGPQIVLEQIPALSEMIGTKTE